MRTSSVVSIVLAFIVSLAAAVESQRSTDILAWPLSASTPTKLTTVSYTSTNATLKGYDFPKIPDHEEIVRVGFYHKSGKWSGIATSAKNFAIINPMRLILHVKDNGELYHVGFKANDPITRAEGKPDTSDWLNVEVVKIRPGPVPALNKPVVVTADGQVEGKEPEKTFLQKYWWAIGLFLLLQVVMGGKGE
ncbi:hypothetical protein AC579_6460 [Pseudocercospora musae]|uniref:Uncharacterized protein n=1 Tax=Pseudocercospora musae TaxID=113226 RepID=A0A139IKM3_9PEZI|nr:hypothetical protein AC579_6460 [Pseudocercospora musae]